MSDQNIISLPKQDLIVRDTGDLHSVINCFAWSPDGEVLVIGLQNGKIKSWHHNTGKITDLGSGLFNFFASLFYPPTVLAWSPTKNKIACIRNRRVIFMDPDTGTILNFFGDFGGEADTIAWAPNGKKVACANLNVSISHALSVRDISTGDKDWGVYAPPFFPIKSIAWSTDGSIIAVAIGEGSGVAKVQLLNAKDGALIQNLEPLLDSTNSTLTQFLRFLTGEWGRICTIAWSATGNRLLFGCDNIIFAWNPRTNLLTQVAEIGQKRNFSQGVSDLVTDISLSSDSRMLAVRSLSSGGWRDEKVNEITQVLRCDNWDTITKWTEETTAEMAINKEGISVLFHPKEPLLASLSRKSRKVSLIKVDDSYLNEPFSPDIFISYSHKDQLWLDRLLRFLSPVIRNETIKVWHDKEINAGQKWRDEIDRALKTSKIGILLVSDNFLASDFINKEELPYLLSAAEKGLVKILWFTISHCLWNHTELELYESIYPPKYPLNSLNKSEQDKALKQICERILKAVKSLDRDIENKI